MVPQPTRLESVPGVMRLTLPLPVGPGHVHCYLLEEPDGWTLVDTGLGTSGLDEELRGAFAALPGGVRRIVITHFHPDHVGGAACAAEASGAPVLQGEVDYGQCVRVWGSPDWPQRIARWFRRHGVPAGVADQLHEQGEAAKPLIQFVRDPGRLRAGDRVGSWEVLTFPGHADGHLCLLRGGILVAGDHLLPRISPAVGLYPDSEPDPLGDYLVSLGRTAELAPRLALPGHGEPVLDPRGRALELIEHHRTRLDETAACLRAGARTGYEVSLALFGRDLDASGRRFAVAEALSHLERLVREGRARRAGDGAAIVYTAAQTALDDELPPSTRAPESGA